MLEMLVLRHAKSRWGEPGTTDHDRTLAPRGVEAAKRMGRLIRERDWLPDRILCSTAARASATLALAMATWPERAAPAVEHTSRLYMASPQQLLEVVRAQAAGCKRLLLVGHNPGMGAFVLRLAGAGEPAALAAVEEKFPTAALARLGLDLEQWRNAEWGSARLLDFIRPKDL
ncbi:MAG: histidine phosphatase family protein [Geminicoccaceae bacterium]|mgnify:CR=1 FL=1|nr:histidine phosphatase family protein [Geminicoccaceae bacterium]